MDQLPTAWETFFELIRRPHLLLQGTLEYAMAWLFTRRWLAILSCLPIVLVVSAACGLVAFGNWRDQGELTQEYFDLASAEIEDVQTEAESAEFDRDSATLGNELLKAEKVSEFGELLLRRVLQLKDSDSRATYLVATQVGRNGRRGQARQMMRSLAPNEADGFPAAHAWLAVDALTSGIKDNNQYAVVMHDLKVAAEWSGTGAPLIAEYVNQLKKQNKVSEALQVLGANANKSETLQLLLANTAYETGRTKILQDATAKIKETVEQRMRNGTAAAEDYVALANVFLLEQDTGRSRRVAEMGLQASPQSPELKRIISECYRVDYINSFRSAEGETEVNLAMLDAALKSDPSNPAVGLEVARLLAVGDSPSPELEAALATQLGNGQSTALTHILLAGKAISAEKLPEAIEHLELALRQAPGNPSVLNNLALALAMSAPEQMERAQALCARALALEPQNAEYLDTQGEIRALASDPRGAIESYEKAIGLDGNRLGTRKKLADAYRKIGLDTMADIQEKLIRELQESADANADASGNPQSPAGQPE